MKKIILTTIISSSLLFSASNPSKNYEYEVTGYAAGILSDSSNKLKDDNYLNGGLSIAKNLEGMMIDQVELGFLRSQSVEYSTGSNTNMNTIFLNAIKKYGITDKLSAYGLAGLGNQDVSQELGENKDSIFFNWGLGLRYDIPYYGMAIKSDIRHLYAFENSRNDIMYTLGLALPLGKKYKEPIVAKVPLVEEEKKPVVIDGDDDKDGVLNSKDLCPDTLLGVQVNENGCELDDDNDGVINRLDKCPNTSEGIKVNNEGCVATIDLKINFDYNSAKINDKYLNQINKFAMILKENRKLTATIEAHTDSKGSNKYNEILSLKRANSIIKELKNSGINVSRLTPIGYGETKPIAKNTTAEGRAKNRRVIGLINQ
ncbi:OmpA family protein [Malaciobacter sp. WC5094]